MGKKALLFGLLVALALAGPGGSGGALAAADPATRGQFPEKGKSIRFIVPYPAGGSTDVAARMLASLMEKELGTSIQIVNRPGAGSQIGLTELAMAKPDGYTLGYTILPSAVTTALDPARKAVYSRKDFQPLAVQYDLPITLFVKADSPFKTVKDVVDAAKASPGTVKVASTSLQGPAHLGILQFVRLASISLAIVFFDGGAPALTAVLGGHVDFGFNPLSEVVPSARRGAVRVLGVMSKQESKFLPGLKTFEAQGYNAYMSALGGLSGPAGMPNGVVAILSAAARKAMESDEHKKMMEQLGFDAQYMGPEDFTRVWAEAENQIKPLMEEIISQK